MVLLLVVCKVVDVRFLSLCVVMLGFVVVRVGVDVLVDIGCVI